jgi:hypothetical protein
MFNFKKNLIIIFTENKISIKNSFFYDICLVNLGDFNLNNRYKYYFKHKREDKYIILNQIIKFIKYKKYKYIFVIDDDIEIKKNKLLEFFNLIEQYDLNIAQPSVSNKNLFFDFMNPKKNYLFRIVNFLDMRAVAFKSSILEEISKFFHNGSIGMEWVIPKLLDYEKVAIVDNISVRYKNNFNIYDDPDNLKKLNFILENEKLQPIFVEFNNRKIENLEKHKSIKFRNDDLRNFKRPGRRSNGCFGRDQYLSNRIMNLS